MRSILLKSPAKLNLYLKVINKRKDGFHNLVTLFERIDLCDDIRLTDNIGGRIRVFCNHPRVPTGPRNLVYKVAAMLKSDFALSRGVDIRINKRIPVAAGLAGGSSNAAAVLLGLNRLWRLALSHTQLLTYAKKVGSDVPFFLYGSSWAVGTDRGDRIRKVNLPIKLWHVLVVPKAPVYTAKVFGALSLKAEGAPNLKLTKKWSDVNILIRALRNNDIFKAGRLLSNDLESAILDVSPNIVHLRDKLRNYNTLGAAFSGSGPSIYSLVKTKKEAKKLSSDLKRNYSQVFVVRTL